MSNEPVGKYAWIWPLLIAGLIFLASSRPVLASPRLPGTDKVAHFAVYGLLATLTVRLGRGWRAAAVTVIAVSAYGASDEWHQSFVPGRSVELADWLCDTVGGAVAAAAYARWPAWRRVLERKLGARSGG